MFSVIIPLYNKSPYIKKAINSVLTQTYSDFELLIINDGSTDDSLSIVQQFSDSRIKIYSQKNAGVSAARNNGVKKANFDYIAFLDADDWWHKDFLKEMKSLITQFPDAGIYGNRYWYVKNNKLKLTNVGLPENFKKGYINYFKIYSNTFAVPFNCSFVIVKKHIFNDVGGFNANLKFGEDFDLWVRIALKQKIGYLNKPMAYSNQDVDIYNRALGAKLWNPENHFIFNLDYLQVEEKTNLILKKLLDGLRVRALVRYRMAGEHTKEIQNILKKVDFTTQPKYYQRIYNCPLFIVKLYFKYKITGSMLKQKLIKIKN